jgi:hypothetical protein
MWILPARNGPSALLCTLKGGMHARDMGDGTTNSRGLLADRAYETLLFLKGLPTPSSWVHVAETRIVLGGNAV